MVDHESAIIAERREHPGVCTAPHHTVHRILMFLKLSDHFIRWGPTFQSAGKQDFKN